MYSLSIPSRIDKLYILLNHYIFHTNNCKTFVAMIADSRGLFRVSAITPVIVFWENDWKVNRRNKRRYFGI